MRPRVFEEPTSAAAVWSRRLALFSLLLTAVGILGCRYGFVFHGFYIKGVDRHLAVALLFAAVVLAFGALLSAFIAMSVLWRTGCKGFGAMLTGFFLSLLLLAYPAYLANLAWRLPALTDVSTDLDDPPAFSMSPRALRLRDRSELSSGDPSVLSNDMRQRQIAEAPDIGPLILDSDVGAAYHVVFQLAAEKGWQIVESVPPSGGIVGAAHAGRVDAIARDRFFGLPNDVAIRIRPQGTGSRIDIRARTLYLPHDFGANAEMIRQFMAELQGEED